MTLVSKCLSKIVLISLLLHISHLLYSLLRFFLIYRNLIFINLFFWWYSLWIFNLLDIWLNIQWILRIFKYCLLNGARISLWLLLHCSVLESRLILGRGYFMCHSIYYSLTSSHLFKNIFGGWKLLLQLLRDTQCRFKWIIFYYWIRIEVGYSTCEILL